MFHIAREEDIRRGKLTDIYFKRTEEILRFKKINPCVKAEVMLKSFPPGYSWGILAGVEETLRLLTGLDRISVKCMSEGSYFREYEPVMTIEGKYLDFGVYETAILGFLCQASGIATSAARFKICAGQKQIFSFGARRVHPSIAPMVDRNAFIGGADGVSTIPGAELIGEEPVGTIPHELILIIGDTVEATLAFDEIIKPEVSRISLIDTFNDEKFEAINVSRAMGDKLFGLRLDTPSSRRGDFRRILEEIRWELDIRGFKDVKLMVSGGISEKDIIELKDIVDAFGVGTSISAAPIIDFALDIVEIEGKPIAKRGKRSGGKKVLRCSKCGEDIVVRDTEKPEDYSCISCGGKYDEVLVDAIRSGKSVYDYPEAGVIRDRVIKSFRFLDL
jgi:nicotinate phosphoribosyltransferase